MVLPGCAALLILPRSTVRTGSHGPSDLSPVCMAAALHFDLWVPNFGVQEFMGYSEQMLEVFPHNWTFEGGYMHPRQAVTGH